MKTKQAKEDLEKSIDEDATAEPKTRARKKVSDCTEEDKSKQDESKPSQSKEPKKNVARPKAIVKKKPQGIRKTLRSRKTVVKKDAVKNAIKQTAVRRKKPAATAPEPIKIKTEPDTDNPQETVPVIPVSEIKKEPVDETSPNSRSSSPRTAAKRQRISSDMMMMKSVLGDSPNSLVVGPRTSPYLMRSERSNSPTVPSPPSFESKNLRSGKPRKANKANNLLNEVVMKEQKKRRRLLSDAKAPDGDTNEDCKKLKRGRSCSRDSSEISKCSDITESDLSLGEPLLDMDNKELNKKIDKPKTDLDIDTENNLQISTIAKVPFLNVDSKLAETKPDTEPGRIINDKNKKSLSLKRSTSLDSDNNNSNRIKLEHLNSSDVEDKSSMKTENDTLSETSSILNIMSKTFNSKEVTKNIRKARRGRKAAAATRVSSGKTKRSASSTVTSQTADDKQETLESLSKEINDLINNLDQQPDHETTVANESTVTEKTDHLQTKSVSKFFCISKPLGDNNSIISPDTPVKDKDAFASVTADITPSKIDDSENIRLHYEEDTIDQKPKDTCKQEITYKCSPVASIDKLMDRLKEFEEFDKRRQRQESESKSNDGKPVMVGNDVVLITKSGTDIKQLKDIPTLRSPERPVAKENLLSCFENNSAISIVKRDHHRRSIDIDLTNPITLIKRNSISSRKESTNSNHSKDDAISIFEKSLGRDVTLTEIRKSVDKTPPQQVELHQFATLHPNNPNQALVGVVIDSKQISITPCVTSEVQITKRASCESLSRKSSESAIEEDKMQMATIEKIKSPTHTALDVIVTPSPVAMKSPETTPSVEAEALAPPLESIEATPDMTMTSKAAIEDLAEVTKIESSTPNEITPDVTPNIDSAKIVQEVINNDIPKVVEKMDVDNKEDEEQKPEKQDEEKIQDPEKSLDSTPKIEEEPEKSLDSTTKMEEEPEKSLHSTPKIESSKSVKSVKPKSARNSLDSQPGPSNVLLETPESQKRKENVLRTLGLLTLKAANEAKIEKLKEKERIYSSNKNAKPGKSSGDYTGTLKTVIKLNRGSGDREKKRYRSSLKMTFQKSKHRGKPQPELGETAAEDDAYYTIERREAVAASASDGGHRKSYSNRLNNHEVEAAPEVAEPKETINLVIPEKASSFSIHPGRLCMDQCFYCGGKFGLFDTPCHIAQMKSSERQKKVLDNEEKLTIDSCLCDACYRHVDRRANCPSYRKRPPKALSLPAQNTLPAGAVIAPSVEKPPSPADESDDEAMSAATAGPGAAVCHTAGCARQADRAIRRKWLLKLRPQVNKLLQLEGDYPGLHTIPLCSEHYRALQPLMQCALCLRRVTKHHNVHLPQNYEELNPLLSGALIPVQFTSRPVLCKLCRYYCTLLARPNHNEAHANAYHRKLLQLYNIEVPPEPEPKPEAAPLEDATSKQKKKRTKSKQRKSSDPEKPGEESLSSEKTESSPEKEKQETVTENPSQDQNQEVEEDIESLISSNKIPVPGASIPPETQPNDTETAEENPYDFNEPLLPVDKQTELQYLLQKQNNPAQFLPNLTQKKPLKMPNLTGITKPAQIQKISDKNAKRIQKLGQTIIQKEKPSLNHNPEVEMFDPEKQREALILKNLNEECTIESIPNKKPADINTLKNKWQMSESFSQVKKNLSELSKKLTIEKDPKKTSDVKYSNPVKRLETNPSISVRELFPGEEEMNLQCNIEFNNVKGVTPEGWEKSTSMIQYDSETKRLWTELQRPYGNQSSFLRHLILLEKYFRSGDLVLSHNATPHAANYSDSVQSRLRAYDNVVNDTPRRSEPAISLIEYRKKPSVNGKSLLKHSQVTDSVGPKSFMPPPILPKPPKSKSDKSKSKPLPPELIAINTPNAQGRKAIQNVLHNIQQLVKGVSASDPTEVAASPLPPLKFDAPPQKEKEKKDKDTPKKSKPTSKPWRPTLMPITQENLARIAREPTQTAVDGRRLPSLVQVMSSGKRYHITLQDYNKMCVMRREKLQQLHDGEPPSSSATITAIATTSGTAGTSAASFGIAGTSAASLGAAGSGRKSENTTVTEIQTSAMLGNGGTVVQTISNMDKEPETVKTPDLQISSNAATILKNVGLKNITIAPIPLKTSTVTSLTPSLVTSPSLLVSTPIKLPNLGPAVSITSETVLTPAAPTHTMSLPSMSTAMIMPKIPKSLTVIPQTVVAGIPQNVVMSQGIMMQPSMLVPQSVAVVPSTATPVLAADSPRP